MAVDQGVAEDASNIAFHHAAETVITCAYVDTDVVNLVLEGLQMVAAVDATVHHGFKFAAVSPTGRVRRNARHFVVGTMVLTQFDADAVQRVIREILCMNSSVLTRQLLTTIRH